MVVENDVFEYLYLRQCKACNHNWSKTGLLSQDKGKFLFNHLSHEHFQNASTYMQNFKRLELDNKKSVTFVWPGLNCKVFVKISKFVYIH